MEINKEELEKIQYDEQLIRETAEWWHREINEKLDRLNELSTRDDSTYDEIQNLRKQVAVLNKKGQEEQRFLEEHEQRKKKFLFNYMLSGCLNLNLDYK